MITQGVKHGKHFTIWKGHLVTGHCHSMLAYARYGLRGGTEGCESYLSLHNDRGRGRFPVTVSWRKA